MRAGADQCSFGNRATNTCHDGADTRRRGRERDLGRTRTKVQISTLRAGSAAPCWSTVVEERAAAAPPKEIATA
jgi:hypothetical protein